MVIVSVLNVWIFTFVFFWVSLHLKQVIDLRRSFISFLFVIYLFIIILYVLYVPGTRPYCCEIQFAEYIKTFR